jgi:hypothetical protein
MAGRFSGRRKGSGRGKLRLYEKNRPDARLNSGKVHHKL